MSDASSAREEGETSPQGLLLISVKAAVILLLLPLEGHPGAPIPPQQAAAGWREGRTDGGDRRMYGRSETRDTVCSSHDAHHTSIPTSSATSLADEILRWCFKGKVPTMSMSTQCLNGIPCQQILNQTLLWGSHNKEDFLHGSVLY